MSYRHNHSHNHNHDYSHNNSYGHNNDHTSHNYSYGHTNGHVHTPGLHDNMSMRSRSSFRSRNGTLKRYEVRQHVEDLDEDQGLSSAGCCCLCLMIIVAEILLIGVMILIINWVYKYQTKGGNTFGWRDDPTAEFNLHPVLMVAGFIFFTGQAMLTYRICRCCKRIWVKLVHTLFHVLAIPCIFIGFVAVLDSHNLRVDSQGNPAPIPNFYSLHSWMGLVTMVLYAMQFLVGFFSFLLLLCCESATASFRSSLVPLHTTIGLSTFLIAIATACVGLTEKAFFSLSIAYSKWVPYLTDYRFNSTVALSGLSTLGPQYTRDMFEESLVINSLGLGLILLGIVIPVIVTYPGFRYSRNNDRHYVVREDRYG